MQSKIDIFFPQLINESVSIKHEAMYGCLSLEHPLFLMSNEVVFPDYTHLLFGAVMG